MQPGTHGGACPINQPQAHIFQKAPASLGGPDKLAVWVKGKKTKGEGGLWLFYNTERKAMRGGGGSTQTPAPGLCEI